MLHLLRYEVDKAKLEEFARRTGRPSWDTGYIMHAHQSALFGQERVLRPFSIGEATSGCYPVLGYAESDAATLVGQIEAFGDPEAYGCIRRREGGTLLDSKPLPEKWSTGLRVAFRVKVNPTVHAEDTKGKRREMDHFQYLRGKGVEVDRPTAYADWAEQRFVEEVSGARLDEVDTVSSGVTVVCRYTQDKVRKQVTGRMTEAVLEGICTIIEPIAFSNFLRTGVGRKRAFGYGMMQLRPAIRT